MDWTTWYEQQQSDAIDQATEKICGMIQKLREASGQIDRDMFREWVKDIVLEKSYIRLTYQEAILRKLAALKGST